MHLFFGTSLFVYISLPFQKKENGAPKICAAPEFTFRFYTQGSQSTLMAPQVELPQSWMNFSMEKTPVRSSTLRPYSAWRPFSCGSAVGSREIQPIWATPMTLLFKLASSTPVQHGVTDWLLYPRV